MTYFRCINDTFGYCKDTPDWDVEPQGEEAETLVGGHCRQDSKTCKKYQTLAEQVAGKQAKMETAEVGE